MHTLHWLLYRIVSSCVCVCVCSCVCVDVMLEIYCTRYPLFFS